MTTDSTKAASTPHEFECAVCQFVARRRDFTMVRNAAGKPELNCSMCAKGKPVVANTLDKFTAAIHRAPMPAEQKHLGDEIFQRLREAKREDYEHALATLRRLTNPVSRDTVPDGELVDAVFEFVSRLDLANPLVPLMSHTMERLMFLAGIEETPRGLKRDYFTEAS